MCDRTSKNENRILTISALLASGFAAGGMVLGLLVGSIVIVFDGVYSLVSLLLTLLSLAASSYISKPSKSVFPFGKAVLEPIVIAIKAAVILVVVCFSLYSAISALMTGGREVDTSIATIFGRERYRLWLRLVVYGEKKSSVLIRSDRCGEKTMANGYAIKRGSYCWFYRCMASISYPIRALRSLRGPNDDATYGLLLPKSTI